jgi:hypothetical protein
MRQRMPYRGINSMVLLAVLSILAVLIVLFSMIRMSSIISEEEKKCKEKNK